MEGSSNGRSCILEGSYMLVGLLSETVNECNFVVQIHSVQVLSDHLAIDTWTDEF